MSSPQNQLRHLINNQRSDIIKSGNYGKMDFQDVKRIDRYIQGDIFLPNECCIYMGEIKNKYSTISYNRKKVSVLRLLYHNYVHEIEKKDIIEYLCDNSGVCCSLHHFKIKNKEHIFKQSKHKMNIDYDIKPFDDPRIDDCDINDDNNIFTFD